MAAIVCCIGKDLVAPDELIAFEPRLPYFAVPLSRIRDELRRPRAARFKFKLRDRGITERPGIAAPAGGAAMQAEDA